MAQDTILQAKGLVTQYNALAVAPGTYVQCDNAVIRRENVVESRRGHAAYGSLANTPTQLAKYLKKVIAHHGSTLSYDNGSGTFTDFLGTITAPTGYRLRGVEALSNLYVTTDKGVKVCTALAAQTPRQAGSPRMLDVNLTLTGASGFLSNTQNVAYRTVLKRTDDNSNVLFGYPSQRGVIYNSAGASRNVIVKAYFPTEVTTSDVIQVYRTEGVASVAGEDTAADEMALVYQVKPSSADITNGFIQFTDIIEDELRGASLYTSPSQEGISQANDRPPLCKDIALYRSNYLFYVNTSTKQRMFFTLVGTSSLSAKTITLGGVTYNFGATEITSGGGSPQVKVSATGVAAVDIDLTARSLVNVINRYAPNTSVYAYYLSGPDDLPGQILIEERGVGATAFTNQGSDALIGAMFFPAPPISPATSDESTSSNQVQKNGAYFSKAQQLEAVPALNYLPVGPANAGIIRAVALRDSVIFISEAGVYRLTGETSQSFTIQPLDLTVFCKCPDSIAVLANQVFMLSNQGIVAISDTGVQVVSREIEPELLPLLTYSGTATNTYGVAYESERSYIISTIESSAETSPSQCFIYNAFTRTWTRWSFGFTCALVEESADKLYMCKPAIAKVYRERKDFSDTDYADPEEAITLNSISGKSITLTTTGGVIPEIGDVIEQGSAGFAITVVVDNGSGSYTVTTEFDASAVWSSGAANLFPSVGYDVEWSPWTGTQPGILKHVRQVSFLTDSIGSNNTATVLFATFRSDIDPTREEVEITSSARRWGSFPWGILSWGGSSDTFAYPTYVSRNKQYCRTLSLGIRHRKAREKISLAGVSLTFEAVSERISK